APLGTYPAAALWPAGDGVDVDASTRGLRERTRATRDRAPAAPPPGGRRLGAVCATTSTSDFALLVKQVRQRWWFEPDIGITADPFSREGQDIAVEMVHERADGHVQLGGVAPLFHEHHEHGPQEARTALLHAVLLLRAPGPGGQQAGFLQQTVEPAI